MFKKRTPIKDFFLFFFCMYFSRGMKFENVQTLTDAIYDIILDMKWCWYVFLIS